MRGRKEFEEFEEFSAAERNPPELSSKNRSTHGRMRSTERSLLELLELLFLLFPSWSGLALKAAPRSPNRYAAKAGPKPLRFVEQGIITRLIRDTPGKG